MEINSIGFIGSGRVAAFMLEGFARAGVKAAVTLSDADPAVSSRRAAAYPTAQGAARLSVRDASRLAVRDVGSDFAAAAAADVVFLALHPQATAAGAASISGFLRPNSILVSLAPKVSMATLRSATGFSALARFLPSAPSAIAEGYNPISFATELLADARVALADLLGTLGTAPEVDESTLEAYAVLCAMGPTYLWPLFDEMKKLGAHFGLAEAEARRAISLMASGAASLFGSDDRTFADLMDMIPAKPMADDESKVRDLFATRLSTMFGKLKS
jgi:pyrroline-5-carboxylate reductase